MNTADVFHSTNPLIKDSLLGSKYFNPEYLFDRLVAILSHILTAKTLEGVYVVFSVLAICCVAVITYTTIRMFEIRKKEHKHLQHELAEYAHKQTLKENQPQREGIFKNERWKKVLDYLFSTNENDWRLAIIETDLMLFDLLTKMGFKGESLGDKLKETNRDNFHNLNSAWEAHNIRNKITHEGSSFHISLHEAKRVIALYEQIFEEFRYI